MQRGYLVIANDVAADVEDEFNRWYQNEHLPERLGVPGFRNVRRYVTQEASLQYFAVYETDDPDVLTSPAYCARLGDPTPWTQRVMPAFRNMHRTVMRARYRAMRGMGAVLDLLVFDGNAGLDHMTCDRIFTALSQDVAFEGMLVLGRIEMEAANGTAEGSLRGGPDASMPVAALVQWALLPGAEPRAAREVFDAAGLRPLHEPGGRYRLMTARGCFDLG